MANPLVIYDANTNLIEILGDDDAPTPIPGISNALTGAAINNATCTVTLKDINRVNLVGTTWPVTMSYIAASSGKYRGVVGPTLSYPKGENGYAVIDITGDTYTARIEAEVQYVVRKK